QGQSGNEPQLSDIIKKQEGLAQKMQKGMQKGQSPGDGKPDKDGKGGKQGQGGEGEGGSEGDAGELLGIYKEQQQLREQLQQALEKQGMGGNGQNAARQMKEIEKQLLNKGFKNDVLQRMQNLKHELLKLDKALQQQGEENKRQSQTNKKEFNTTNNQLPEALKEYLNSVEILNRQTLPLRPQYNQKVQNYFKTND
ncbi:glutamyl-tRNA synthetase, partial [Nostoc linckia z15]